MRERPGVRRGSAARTSGVPMNWQAPIYDGCCSTFGLGEPFRRETLRHAELRPGERMLDVGCGTGVLALLAAEATGPAGEVVGIDPAPRMIAIARAKARETGSAAQFKLGVIERLPFEDASFEVVLSSLMLHHLPSEVKRAGLQEVYRVLKPGGRLVVVDIDRPANAWWWLLVWPLLLSPMTRGNLRGAIPGYLQAAGFTAVTAQGHWLQLLGFWRALKPEQSGSAT